MVSKTPRPLPQFYQNDSPSFSTKKEKQTPPHTGGLKVSSAYRPPAKTAPPVMSRVYPARYNTLNHIKPKFISFAPQTSVKKNPAASPHYDCSKQESYFEQTFEILGKLGEGSFGEVFRARSKEDGKVYAVKRAVQKFRGTQDRSLKLREVQKHELLPKHTNLVEFVRAWEERGRLYIQTELCRSSLTDLLENNHEVPESLVWKYLADLLLAVKHLHDHDLVHLDIKPENIFVSQDGLCKLGDFGLVVDLTQLNVDEVREGDAKYLAPELLRGIVGTQCDIFSLGLTILEVACDLDVPQSGESWQLLRRGRLPEDHLNRLSPELVGIITRMMDPLPANRPSAAQLLNMAPIRRVVKSRQRYVTYLSLVDKVKAFFCLFVVFFQLLWSVLCGWVQEGRDNSSDVLIEPRSPLDNVAVPLRFEHSSSDDEDETLSILKKRTFRCRPTVPPCDLATFTR